MREAFEAYAAFLGRWRVTGARKLAVELACEATTSGSVDATVMPSLATLAFREARDRAEAEELWEVRRKCSGAMFALGDSKLNEDIVVPMRSYEKFAVFLDKLRKSSRLSIPTFGHLADGNLHVNIMYHRENRAEYLRAEKAVGQLMAGVVKLGGAISGEAPAGAAVSLSRSHCSSTTRLNSSLCWSSWPEAWRCWRAATALGSRCW